MRNVPGPFYVVKDRCMSCGAPEAEANGLIAYDEETSTCFFARQPSTEDETYRAIRAVWVSCCSALRYDGSDPEVNRRLSGLGQSEQVDRSLLFHLASKRRRVVTFGGSLRSPSDVLRAIAHDLVAHYSNATFADLTADAGSAAVLYSWPNGRRGATLTVRPSWDGDQRLSLSVDTDDSHAVRRVGVELDDALRRLSLQEVRWYVNLKSSRWWSFPV